MHGTTKILSIQSCCAFFLAPSLFTSDEYFLFLSDEYPYIILYEPISPP